MTDYRDEEWEAIARRRREQPPPEPEWPIRRPPPNPKIRRLIEVAVEQVRLHRDVQGRRN